MLNENEQEIDLRELWQVVLENKKTIAAVTAAFVIGAGIYLLVVSPTYQSTSLLRIKPQQSLGDSILSSLPVGSDTQIKQQMNTDAEILKSRTVVEPIIKEVSDPDKNGDYPLYDGYVKGHIVTKPFKDTAILEVDVTGKSPEQAQKANSLLVKGFLKRLADLSRREQQATREFLQQRVVSAKSELDTAESKLQDFQTANKIYSTDDQMKGLTEQLSLIDKTKAENQLDMETAKAALNSVNGQLGSAGQSIADSPAIQQYKVQLAQLEETKAGYIGKYTDEHPKMQEINRQIQQTREALNQEIGNIVSQNAPSSSTVQQGLLADKFKNEAAIAVAEGKNKALAQLDARNNTAIEALPEKERGYIRVKRDADVAQEIYIMLAKRLEEAKVAEVMVPNEVQIVDAATLPEKPVKPRKTLTMALALILGLLCGTGCTVARSLLNRKIKTADDVEQYLQLPVLGMIPDAHSISKERQHCGRSIREWIERIRRTIWKK